MKRRTRFKAMQLARMVVFSLALMTEGACGAGGLPVSESELWVVYDGWGGPGQGKHVVLVSGDEEYRSEEALPQLARILARRHGFKCTVLFAIDPNTGTIAPDVVDNIPGLQALESADLLVLFTRFRELPDPQMEKIDRYLASGRPIIGLRTATHAFRYAKDSSSRYRHYDFRSKVWDGGFGRQVLGETWIAHHGRHGVESTLGILVDEMKDHPILRGWEGIWGPTDVYKVRLPLCADCQPLVLGQVLSGMNPTDEPVLGARTDDSSRGGIQESPNDPMMPVAWIKTYEGKSGNRGRVFTTTMGASQDLANEGLRRLLVNAVYWCLGMEEQLPPKADVDLVGDYQPTPFGFGKFRAGLRPSDHVLQP